MHSMLLLGEAGGMSYDFFENSYYKTESEGYFNLKKLQKLDKNLFIILLIRIATSDVSALIATYIA